MPRLVEAHRRRRARRQRRTTGRRKDRRRAPPHLSTKPRRPRRVLMTGLLLRRTRRASGRRTRRRRRRRSNAVDEQPLQALALVGSQARLEAGPACAASPSAGRRAAGSPGRPARRSSPCRAASGLFRHAVCSRMLLDFARSGSRRAVGILVEQVAAATLRWLGVEIEIVGHHLDGIEAGPPGIRAGRAPRGGGRCISNVGGAIQLR